MTCGQSENGGNFSNKNKSSSTAQSLNNRTLYSGEYVILKDSKTIGKENFKIALLKSGRISASSSSITNMGYKYQQTGEYLADSNWNIYYSKIAFHGGGLTKTEVISLRKNSYVCSLSTGDGRIYKSEFENAPEYFIKYNLSIFCIPILSYLIKNEIKGVDVKSLFIEPGSLKPFDAIFHYSFTKESIITVPAGNYKARLYLITDKKGNYHKYFWADKNGIVLACGDNSDGNNERRLIKYNQNNK